MVSANASPSPGPRADPEPPPQLSAEASSPDQHTYDFYHQLTVFSVSAAMVGVCLTGIGLIQVVQKLLEHATLADELLAADGAVFLTAMFCSFVSMRLRFRGPWRAFALVADVAVLAGMALMVVCS